MIWGLGDSTTVDLNLNFQLSPAIGQALGLLNIYMIKFCKAFNDRTSKMTENTQC